METKEGREVEREADERKREKGMKGRNGKGRIEKRKYSILDGRNLPWIPSLLQESFHSNEEFVTHLYD